MSLSSGRLLSRQSGEDRRGRRRMTSTTDTPTTNDQLIPVYKDWVNRCLFKSGLPLLEGSLIQALRSPSLLLSLTTSVAPPGSTEALQKRLSRPGTSDEDGVSLCLHLLSSLGVDTSRVSTNQLVGGHIGSQLQLLFSLSHFKHEQRLLRKQQREAMQAASRLSVPQSRIQPPGRIPISSRLTPSPVLPSPPPPQVPSPAPPVLKPPSGTRLARPTNTKTRISSPSLSSASYASIPSVLASPSTSSSTPKIPKPGLRPPSSSPLRPPSSPAPPKHLPLPSSSPSSVPSAAPEALATPPSQPRGGPSKMLKLFGKEKKKEEKSVLNKPSTTSKLTVVSTRNVFTSPKMKTPSIRPPSSSIATPKRINPPTMKTSTITTTTKIRPPRPPSRKEEEKDTEEIKEKRSSKTSEDSAYCELSSSASPSSSTSSVSPLVLSDPPPSRLPPPSSSHQSDPPSLEKPILAVKGRQVRIVEPPEVVEGIEEVEVEESMKTIPSVGVVTPMVTTVPSTTEDKRPPPLPSIAKDTSETEKEIRPSKSVIFDDSVPPPMTPVSSSSLLHRRPPSYSQLCIEGRITPHSEEVDPSIRPSSSSLTYPSMVRLPSNRPSRDSSMYSGVPLRDLTRDDSSISSSSSVSSDLSDQRGIEDLLSSPEYMAAVYASRQQLQRNPRSSSTGERSRHLVNQENISALLKQCKTSKRGSGCQWPLSSTEGVDLPPRLSTLTNNGYGGLHSLERKSRVVSHVYREEPPSSDRAALALVSPRRSPYTAPSNGERHSLSVGRLSSSGMSRSMVLLDGMDSRSPSRIYETSSCMNSPRRLPPSSPRLTSRLPLSLASPSRQGSLRRHENIYANCAALREAELQLHKNSLPGSPSHTLRSSGDRDFRGSQLSLASSCAFSTVENVELDRLVRHLHGCQQQVTSLTRTTNNYVDVLESIEGKLGHICRAVDRHKNLTPDDLKKLRYEIETVRQMSARARSSGIVVSEPVQIDGSPLRRDPSMESVASVKSSMSTSSKNNRMNDKNSLGKGQKKSWFRSSITKVLHKNGKKKEENGVETQCVMTNLQKELKDRDHTLNELRMDSLNNQGEVQRLQEALKHAKSENQQLKADISRITHGGRSRASSRASIPVDDDCCVYDVPPSSSRSSASSKRSSGCGLVRVSVNVDLRGKITSVVSPEHEITVGCTPLPSTDITWNELDQQLFTLFSEYLLRIDPDHALGLHSTKSVIGYQIGDTTRDLYTKALPLKAPHEAITTTSTIRMFLRGAAQSEVDSLVLGSLFPRKMVTSLLTDLLDHRRLLLAGATGIGKSQLARQLASLLAERLGLPMDAVHDLRMPEDTRDANLAKTQHELECLLSSSSPSVVLLDNVPRVRVSSVSTAIASSPLPRGKGPFIIATVNRACQLHDSATHQTFKTFLLTNKMEGVKGLMGRFLRRSMAEREFRSCTVVPFEMIAVVDFLENVLTAVNAFIEKANSLDVTVGPRTFLACPLDVDESRMWFIQLWNDNILPYMVKVATEGVKVLGRYGSFDDPTDTVCDGWPWVEGPPAEKVLRRLSSCSSSTSSKEDKTTFNALDALIRVRTVDTE